MIYKLSKRGEYHEKKEEKLQDYFCSKSNSRFVVLVLADGVSTCKFSDEGAKVSSEALKEILFEKAEYFLEFNEEKTADYLMSHVLYELKAYIEGKEGKLEDYSSTLSAILYDLEEERYLTFNLGDGVILGSGYGRIDILSNPCDSTFGCPVTTSRDVLKHVVIKKVESANYESVMLCSDGCWKELFNRNKIREEVSSLLNESDFDGLSKHLKTLKTEDDCSFIAATLT